jgi:hypothetical protein
MFKKMFFSEEKAVPALREPKDLYACAGGKIPAMASSFGTCGETKVFCFFLQKRRLFLLG